MSGVGLGPLDCYAYGYRVRAGHERSECLRESTELEH